MPTRLQLKLKRPGRTAGTAILPDIRALIDQARGHVATTANVALVALYWNIGRIITLDMQSHSGRADYGGRLLERLSRILTRDYGKGYSASNLSDMRRFFEAFEIPQAAPVELKSAEKNVKKPVFPKKKKILQAAPVKLGIREGQILEPGIVRERTQLRFPEHAFLSWTHYRILLGVEPARKRSFYFDQTITNRWSTRDLEKRMQGALFERVAHSPDTRQLAALEKSRLPVEVQDYRGYFKDPYVLDFLGLEGAYTEKDMESALIHNLEHFLAELGNDFCFVRRQFPMRIDDVDHRLDLLFFHRRLRCLVAIELKLGAFTAADKGQMDLYLSWLKEHEWREAENEPVGLILCASKRRQHVELLLRHGSHKMQVSEYRTGLPDEKLLEDRLKIYSKLLENR